MQAINEGTLTMENFREGFREWLLNILGDIQQSIMDEFITKPITEFIKEGMGSLADLFGPEGREKDPVTRTDLANRLITANDNLTQRAEAFALSSIQQVHVVNASEICACMPAGGGDGGGPRYEQSDRGPGQYSDSGFNQTDPNPYLRQSNIDANNKLKESGAAAKAAGEDFNIAGKDIAAAGVTAIATFGAVYAATGDWKKSMVATFLQMFLEIALAKAAAAIGSMFSSGGSVQRFAAGGGALYRDRVPALLEPGEFVIRKPMAKAIGGPALQRMNAHGQMPAGDVEVNLINKGTPQQAKAQQKPKLDGKGMVIEIVLTDLKNNGPIKQAIRGGGRR